jgi:hypothetical protein
MKKGKLHSFFLENRRAQIWVETVIYTLIAFALIALVLAFAEPKIEELRDKAVLEQSVEMMQEIDLTISEIIQSGSGNKRLIELSIKKGNLEINGENNKLIFKFEGNYLYSEPGQNIQEGNLVIRTEELGELGLVNITRDYANYNITYNEKDISKTISQASNSYNFIISNNGKDGGEKTIINIELQ